MFKRPISFALAVSGLAFGVAAGAFAMQARKVDSFGPTIFNDPTLNVNLGALRQQIAWLNSPESDVFQVAQPIVEEEPSFDSVAMLSTASDALGHFPSVRDDVTLDRSNGVLAQVIAWQNSPAGDAFMVAQVEPMVKGDDFQRVALASIPYGSTADFGQ